MASKCLVKDSFGLMRGRREYLEIAVENVLLSQVFEASSEVLEPVSRFRLRNTALLAQIITQIATATTVESIEFLLWMERKQPTAQHDHTYPATYSIMMNMR
jgi:hypothetical protein